MSKEVAADAGRQAGTPTQIATSEIDRARKATAKIANNWRPSVISPRLGDNGTVLRDILIDGNLVALESKFVAFDSRAVKDQKSYKRNALNAAWFGAAAAIVAGASLFLGMTPNTKGQILWLLWDTQTVADLIQGGKGDLPWL